MTTFTEHIVETFHVVSCASCGIRFGITGNLYKRAVTDAIGTIFCPACGKQTCWLESAAAKQIKELERKLKWEADQALAQRQAREQAEASLQATKGVVTRMKRRAGAGICPCCDRTVRQMAAHLKSKHPEYVAGLTQRTTKMLEAPKTP